MSLSEMAEPHWQNSDLTHALNGIVRDGLPAATLAATFLYVAFALVELFVGTAADRTLLLTSTVTAVVFGATHVVVRRRTVPVSWAHPVLAATCTLVYANLMLRLSSWGDPQHTAYLAVFLIAMGCLFLSLRWLLGILGLAVTGWLVVALEQGPLFAWLRMSYELIAGLVVALLVHHVRVRSYRRFLLLRAEDAELRAQLEATVASLHETQRFNQQIASAAPYVLYVFDLVARRNVFINDRVGEFLGYSTEQFQQWGTHLPHELIHPDDLGDVQRQWGRIAQSSDGDVIESEYRVRHADGTWRWVCTREVVFSRDPDGSVRCILGSAHDVTARRQSEQELSFRAEFDRLITQLSAEFATTDLMHVDAAVHSALERIGRFIGVDRAYLCRFSGEPPAASMTHEWCADGIESSLPTIQNVPIEQFPWLWRRLRNRQPVLMPRVTDLPEEAAMLRQILESKGSQSFLAVPLATGIELWGYLGFASHRRARTWNDDTMALLTIVGDLLLNSVERKQAELAHRESEARLRQILDNAAAVVFLKDLDGRYEFVNRAHERVFHYLSEELRGQDDYYFLPADLADQIRANDARVLEANEPLTVEEVVQHDDGPHTYLVVKFPLHGADGRPYAICGIATDITERKRIEEQIRVLNRDIQHAARLSVMGEMAAGLAHELHQPLAVIVNYARGCVRRLHKGKMEQAVLLTRLQEIADESIRAGRVIDKIRSFLQKREHERKPVELNPIVADALQMARFDRRQTGVQIDFDAGENLPTVVADAVQITQVLLNLVLNGIQAMAANEGKERRLTVTTRRRDERMVEVSVADTGPGLSPEVQSQMFEQFFTTKPEGLGMGLPISRSIILAHGGTLSYRTEQGGGTTFTFTLPVTSKLMERAVREMSRTEAAVDPT